MSELRFGADKRRSKRLPGLVDTFTASIDVVPFDAVAADIFGKASAALRCEQVGWSNPLGHIRGVPSMRRSLEAAQ